MFHPCLPHPSPFRGARGASQRHWHALVAAGWLAALPAFAQQAMTDLSHAPSIYLQGAIAEHDTEALTLGLTAVIVAPNWASQVRLKEGDVSLPSESRLIAVRLRSSSHTKGFALQFTTRTLATILAAGSLSFAMPAIAASLF